MNQDDEKLKSIFIKYRKYLSNQISEFDVDIDTLEKNWDISKLVDLHRKVHSLHGSAGFYGFNEVTEKAGEIEVYLMGLLEHPAEAPAALAIMKTRFDVLKSTIRTALL